MTDVLVFTVKGLPAPQGSKKHVGSGVMVEMSKKLKPWRKAVTEAATHAIGNVGLFDDWEPYTGPVHVTVEFRFPRPKAHYRTGRFAHLLRDDAPDFVITTPDVDKTCRSTLDALTQARVITDDKLVARLLASKVYCEADEPAGATIMVRPLTSPARAVA
jgi:crossover junction endodeoxyribonuclease RusA